MTVWLYESGKGDPIAFHSWADAIAEMMKDDGATVLEDFFSELDEWYVGYEYEPDHYLHVDDGPRVREIEYR